jgi:hypothetical protein
MAGAVVDDRKRLYQWGIHHLSAGKKARKTTRYQTQPLSHSVNRIVKYAENTRI